ncbi:hypothetical protein BC830DRAFT_1158307 [Chytriomyces sp. MP71]|nr:hypothetical protein BC830DRAFT_1158307 [Chytriomyces sp. MP71]
MLTSDNAALRSDAKTQDSKRLLRCHRNLVRNMDSQFWRRILSDLTVKYCVFATCKGYFTMHPYNYEGMFVSPFDWPAMKQHIIYAVLSYCGIDIAYNAVFLPLFIICKTPYVPTFDRPLTSSTLKEFWSTRWNKPIKNSLHRGIFSPLLTGLNARFPAWPRTRHVALAVAATFTASGLIHDYLFATMASNDAPGSQLVFFGGQGLLAAMQWEFVCAMQGTSLGRELVNGPLGKIVGWVISMLSIVIMLPAYCGGMARRGSALHIPVPTAFLDQVQAYM